MPQYGCCHKQSFNTWFSHGTYWYYYCILENIKQYFWWYRTLDNSTVSYSKTGHFSKVISVICHILQRPPPCLDSNGIYHWLSFVKPSGKMPQDKKDLKNCMIRCKSIVSYEMTWNLYRTSLGYVLIWLKSGWADLPN